MILLLVPNGLLFFKEPFVISKFIGAILIILSNILTEDEMAVHTLVSIIGVVLLVYMFLFGIISIHEYGLGKMLWSVIATIIATAIKQKHPDWQVDFLTANFYAEIIKNHPHIDNIICWDRTQRKSFKYVLSIIAKLLKSRYDIIFNLTRATLNIIISLLAFPKKYQGKMNFETTWVEEYFLTAKNKIKDLELPESTPSV